MKFNFVALTLLLAAHAASNSHAQPITVVSTGGRAVAQPNPPTLVAPLDGATGVATSPDLRVIVTDPESDVMDVTFFGRGGDVAAQDFTIIALPDTQNYTDPNQSNSAIFGDQTQWIVDNRAARNIVFVTQLGDCVQFGDSFLSEWQIADAAFGLIEDPITTTLQDGIPFGIAVGNHDQSPLGSPRTGGDESGTTVLYNQFFGLSRFNGRGYYGGRYDFGDPVQYPQNNDNHYEIFSASGMDFIVVHLEYDQVDSAERDAVLSWANGVLQTHADKRTIIVSHWIIGENFQVNFDQFGPQGAAIYEALKGNPNLFLMLCGHVAGEGRRQDTFNNNTVHTLLSDYQIRPNGGNGWLRIMEFSPANNEIRVKTYSPWLDQFETDADSEFTIAYDMGGFAEIGAVTGVASGAEASTPWNALTANRLHEWFVEVSDQTQTTTGPTWTFTTACASDPDCDDGNACTADFCNTNSVCEYFNTNGVCDDGNPCTENDTCSNGTCLGTPVLDCCTVGLDCDDGDPCTDDVCSNGFCLNPPIVNCCTSGLDCDDGNPCTNDICLPTTEVSLSFDGSDDFVDFGSDPSITDYGLNSLTVEGWFNANSVTENFEGLFHIGRRGSNSQVAVYLVVGPQIAVGVEDTAGQPVDTAGAAFSLDEWNHFAAVVDRDNDELRLYLNGLAPVTADISALGGNSISGGADNVVIGALRLPTGVLDTFFAGNLDEVRIWDHARTQTQILNYMNLPVESAPGLIARWGLDEGSGGTTADSVGGNDGTINGAAWSASGAVGSSGGCAFPSNPDCCTSGLDCDDGNPCTDDACVASNEAALSFNGSSDFVDLGSDPSITDFGTNSVTVEGWFDPDSLAAGFPGIFHVGRRGANSQLAVFLFNGDLAVGVEDNAAHAVDVIETTALTTGQWAHFAAVVDRDSDELRLYLNGGTPTTGSIAALAGNPIAGAGDSAALGALRSSGGVLDTFFAGDLDEIRIWDHARTQTEIQDNMNLQIASAPGLIARWGLNEGSGGTTADSVGGNDGTLNGATWITTGLVDLGGGCTFTPIPDCCTSGLDCGDGDPCTDDVCSNGACSNPPNADCCTSGLDCDDGDPCTDDACMPTNDAALSFDGTDDTVEFGSDASITDFGTNSVTVEGWFDPDSLAAGFPGIFHVGRKGTNSQLAVFLFNGDLAAGVEDNAANKLDVIETTALTTGQWAHFAAVVDRDSDELRLYLNGGTPTTGSIAALAGNPIAALPGDAAAIGALRNASGVFDTFFAGDLDEIRIWDHARTQTEIQDNMNLQIASAPGLIARWGLNEGSGGTTADSVGGNDGTLNGATWITTGLVDLGGGCTFTPIPDCCTSGLDCDDGDPCTDDVCSNAVCSNPPNEDCCTSGLDCDDGDPCTNDVCVPMDDAALSFDGTDDTVEFGSDASITDFGTNSVTVEGWFDPDSLAAGFPGIFHVGRKGTNSQLAVFLFNGDLAVGVEDNAANKLDVIETTALTTGQWSHFAAVVDRDSDELRLYLNGGTPTTGSIAALAGNPIAGLPGDAAAIGALRNASGVFDTFFAGDLDEIRIWDHARTQTEIQDNMNVPIASAPGLTARWGLNEGAGGTTADSVGGNDGTLNGAQWITPGAVAALGGCTFTPIPNCCTSGLECDDGNPCTDDMCSNAVCVSEPVDCGPQVCNPKTGGCVDCLAPSELLDQDFNTNSVGDDPAGWLDTAANNSLLENDALFDVKQVGADLVFGTDSTATNIHSHYVADDSAAWSKYEYTGRMRISSAGSAIGVTLLSDYPNQDEYYRLRRLNQAGLTAFHLDQHPNPVQTLSGDLDSGVTPTAGQWVRFRIRVELAAGETKIRARLWDDGTTEPAAWQIDAFDNSASRLVSGTVGVWSFATGSKYWDDLVVTEFLGEPGNCDDGDGCTVDFCSNSVCDTAPVDCSFLDDECALSVCMGTSGVCTALPVNEGEACTDDGDPCTFNVCSNGVCFGRFLDCDADTVCDADDNCPTVPNPLQENGDLDAFGNACDAVFDTDHDGDIDLDDLIQLTACLGGPDIAASAACQDQVDADQDTDVDLQDFGEYQRGFTGPIPSPCD